MIDLKCYRCQGEMYLDKDQDTGQLLAHCFSCGFELPVRLVEKKERGNQAVADIVEKVPKQKVNIRARHMYLEEHRQEIIADFAEPGASENSVRMKWGISSSGWYNIKKRWAADFLRIAQSKGTMTADLITLQGMKEKLEWYRGYRQAVLELTGAVPVSEGVNGREA